MLAAKAEEVRTVTMLQRLVVVVEQLHQRHHLQGEADVFANQGLTSPSSPPKISVLATTTTTMQMMATEAMPKRWLLRNVNVEARGQTNL